VDWLEGEANPPALRKGITAKERNELHVEESTSSEGAARL